MSLAGLLRDSEPASGSGLAGPMQIFTSLEKKVVVAAGSPSCFWADAATLAAPLNVKFLGHMLGAKIRLSRQLSVAYYPSATVGSQRAHDGRNHVSMTAIRSQRSMKRAPVPTTYLM
jgi:hypothetical protein